MGKTTAERSMGGYSAGSAARSAQPMAYATRLEHYLAQNGPNKSSAPELTHLTPAQRKRLHKKLRSHLAAHKRRQSGQTRRLAAAVRVFGRLRPAVAGQQAEIRRSAFAEPSPRLRAAARAAAKRERRGTHEHRD